ncbi:MAG: PAS-domain containing protein [Pseudomonadota bacterium]
MDGQALQVTPPSTAAMQALAEPAFAEMLEHMPWGVLIIGSDGRIKACNKTLRVIFGLREHDIGPGDPVAALLHLIGERGGLGRFEGTLAAEVDRRLAALFGETVPREQRFLADGRVFDILRSRTQDGDLVSVHVDVTEKHRTEAALERQHRQLLSILENISDGVALIDAEKRLIAFNRRWLQLYKVEPSKAWWGMGFRAAAELFGDLQGLPSDQRQQEIDRRCAFALDPTQQRTLRHLCSGETYQLSKEILPDGSTVMTVRDITDTLRQSRALEAERRREREASQHKAQFMTRMSHEMRTPLNGVLGIAALLDRTQLDGTQRKYLTAIRDSGEVLLRLIDDLLDTSRFATDNFELVEQPFLFCAMMREALDLMEPEAARRGIALMKRPADIRLPMLIGDGVRLKQVVLNLLANALKFTAEGSVTAGLKAAVVGGRAELIIEVTDTGIGIAAEDQKRIFEPFSQIKSGAQPTVGGLGLGLSISDRLVSAMGGRIEVTSTSGIGSTFAVHLSLPLAEGDPGQLGTA